MLISIKFRFNFFLKVFLKVKSINLCDSSIDNGTHQIEEGVCKYENYLNGTAVEEANCKNYTCDTTCERFK